MNLFIDSISQPSTLILFSKDREIVAQKEINIAFNESSKLTKEVFDFLSSHKIASHTISNCTVINGPGSFTWVRATTLIANTLAFQTDTTLTPLSFFELFENYPIIKTSSKRDVFIQKSAQHDIEIITNKDCEEYLAEEKIIKTYWDFEKNWDNAILSIHLPDYETLLKRISLKKKKIIEALYIKKPNIS